MKYILGIDVGGTKIASALVDESFQTSDLKVVNTSQTNLTQQLIEIISSYTGFEAIGIAMPGPVLADGLIKKLPNVQNFEPVNYKEVLSTKFNVPVEVQNDAKAFALAEATIGEGVGVSTVAAIVLGTGTGVGLVKDRQILSGKDGLIGEFDHVVMPEGKLFRDYVKESRPYKTASDASPYLRSLISFVVVGFNPDVIILSGGWSSLAGMQEVAQEFATNVGGYENTTPVKISKLQYPSLLGAVVPFLKPSR